jgi:uncharacterized membrane protein YkvA (DUF1232 family)
VNKTPEARPLPRPSGNKLPKPRVFALLPFIRDFPAAWRLVRDRQAPIWSKALVVLSVLYVVWPLDLVPDVVPILSWVDDVGVVLVLRILLHREIEKYREPAALAAPVDREHDGYRSAPGLPVV